MEYICFPFSSVLYGERNAKRVGLSNILRLKFYSTSMLSGFKQFRNFSGRKALRWISGEVFARVAGTAR